MKVGLIGGYGLQEILKETRRETCKAEFEDEKLKYGFPEYDVFHGKIGGREAVVIPRHGVNHHLPPHTVPFKSFIQKLENEGVGHILTTHSVGVMNKSYSVPSFFLIEDFVNEGKEVTYYEKFPNGPEHAPMGNPYDNRLKEIIANAARELGMELNQNVTHVCWDGPRLETKAEIKNKYSRLGDTIGMSGVKEAVLANEKGIPIASVGMGANWAEGISGNVDMDDISDKNKEMNLKVISLFRKAVSEIDQ